MAKPYTDKDGHEYALDARPKGVDVHYRRVECCLNCMYVKPEIGNTWACSKLTQTDYGTDSSNVIKSVLYEYVCDLFKARKG